MESTNLSPKGVSQESKYLLPSSGMFKAAAMVAGEITTYTPMVVPANSPKKVPLWFLKRPPLAINIILKHLEVLQLD
ncbi:hypothetical protein Fmac_001731 [Flemingia macrophylla]|uniref:Uncharacterized protein n=1 Tax=Flemingia macrophylla TaxID=520843 RepID=A0ABD1NII1_9FABA